MHIWACGGHLPFDCPAFSPPFLDLMNLIVLFIDFPSFFLDPKAQIHTTETRTVRFWTSVHDKEAFPGATIPLGLGVVNNAGGE